MSASGTLFVNDNGNKRILIFNNVDSKANNAAADAVLGTANFTTAGSGTVTINTVANSSTQGNMAFANNVLYYPASSQNRVLIFGNYTPTTLTTTIPTVGEWAMILLMLSLFCVAVMYVRKPALAMNHGTASMNSSTSSLFLNKDDFTFNAKWFFSLSFVVTTVVWAVCVYFHETAMRDMIGTALTGIVGGYLLQLLAVWRFDSAQRPHS
jgi:hypothetical protein